MKTYFLLFSFLHFVFAYSFGQSAKSVSNHKQAGSALKKIGIGDRMPDILISNMINYPKGTVRLSDLKGKLIILDFWSTRCSSCIEYLPKVQNLQVKFAGQLQVIGVNYESKRFVQNFFLRQKQITGRNIDLPVVCNDVKLTAYFQVQYFPHYVWIDQKGIVRYVTNVNDVNEENIQAVLENKPVKMDEKIDEDWLDPIYDKPLFVQGNGGDGINILCYSVLSRYVKKMPSTGGYYNPGDSNSSINAINWPVKALFQVAFNDFLNWYHVPDNRTVLQVRDTSKYVWHKKGVLQWQNFYSYQLIAPFRSADSLKKMMQQDLMRYFGLEAHMEKRIMKCWVLTAEDTSLLITKGGQFENNIHAQEFTLKIKNIPDSALGLRFIYNIFYKSPYPFVSEIHMKSNVDILLDKIDYNDMNAVIGALKNKYKLDIRLQEHPIDILVISEPGYKPGADITGIN